MKLVILTSLAASRPALAGVKSCRCFGERNKSRRFDPELLQLHPILWVLGATWDF